MARTQKLKPIDGLLPDTSSLEEEVRLRTRSEAKAEKAAAAAPAPPPAPPPPPPAMGRWRVWAHGPLKHDGVLYPPGSVLDLPTETARALGCLAPVVDD